MPAQTAPFVAVTALRATRANPLPITGEGGSAQRNRVRDKHSQHDKSAGRKSGITGVLQTGATMKILDQQAVEIYRPMVVL
jgi:hypothetical protein